VPRGSALHIHENNSAVEAHKKDTAFKKINETSGLAIVEIHDEAYQSITHQVAQQNRITVHLSASSVFNSKEEIYNHYAFSERRPILQEKQSPKWLSW
jgi:hypothetical protein